MKITSFDHIVLCVNDVAATLDFYTSLLGMERREERLGKWSLHFGDNKISLQDAAKAPQLAKKTVPGSGNFCLLTDDPVDMLVKRLHERGLLIAEGPDKREGATGPIYSVYFRDPDGNLVEVSNKL